MRGESAWIALIDSFRHFATWLGDILSRRERVMRSTIGMWFGSVDVLMVRECDVPAATWMVRLPVAELGSTAVTTATKEGLPRLVREKHR